MWRSLLSFPPKSTTDLPQALCSQNSLAKNPWSLCGKLSGHNPWWRKQLVLQLGPGGEDTDPRGWDEPYGSRPLHSPSPKERGQGLPTPRPRLCWPLSWRTSDTRIGLFFLSIYNGMACCYWKPVPAGQAACEGPHLQGCPGEF